MSRIPKSVDGWNGEGHEGGHGADHEDGDPHDPHNLTVGSLKDEWKVVLGMSSCLITFFTIL